MPQDKERRKNPKTGEREVWSYGQWLPDPGSLQLDGSLAMPGGVLSPPPPQSGRDEEPESGEQLLDMPQQVTPAGPKPNEEGVTLPPPTPASVQGYDDLGRPVSAPGQQDGGGSIAFEQHSGPDSASPGQQDGGGSIAFETGSASASQVEQKLDVVIAMLADIRAGGLRITG